MKKLSIIFALALAFGLSGPATAMDFDISISNYAPGVGETTEVQIAIDGWAGTELKTFDFCLIYDSTKLDVNSMQINDTSVGGCAAAAFSITNDNGTDCARLGGGIFPGTTCNVADDYVLATVVFDCLVADTTTIYIGTDACQSGDGCSHAFAGYIEDDSGNQYPAQAHAEINGPIPCVLNITPASWTQTAGIDLPVTFGGSTTGDCVTPPDYVFSDDCVNGAVDPVTGVFTTTLFYGGTENCTVTVFDNANTGACADCDAEVSIEGQSLCEIEVYVGGYPVPPLNTYAMPGRRGLALTCNDTVQFDYCTTCDPANPGQTTPCPEWSMVVVSGTSPGSSIDSVTGLLTIGDCSDVPAELEITVTDPCNLNISASVTVLVGEIILTTVDARAHPGTDGVQVSVNMENPDHKVKGMQIDMWDANDYLVCTGCAPDPDRAIEYTCSANELADGTCRIMLVTTNPVGMIEEGDGVVYTVDYEVSPSAPSDECITVHTWHENVADRFGDPLCVCRVYGEICFFVCGDVYPRECLPDMPNCGDGVVDIFDILEEIDFVLEIVDPSDCQALRADVPTGTPPYCTPPDGVIDIFDVLVIIDMALGKANCCDYFYFGEIY